MKIAAIEGDPITSEEFMGWATEYSSEQLREVVERRHAALNARLAELALSGESEDFSDIDEIGEALAA